MNDATVSFVIKSVHRITASSLPPGQDGLFTGAFGQPGFSLSCIESLIRREWQVG